MEDALDTLLYVDDMLKSGAAFVCGFSGQGKGVQTVAFAQEARLLR